MKLFAVRNARRSTSLLRASRCTPVTDARQCLLRAFYLERMIGSGAAFFPVILRRASLAAQARDRESYKRHHALTGDANVKIFQRCQLIYLGHSASPLYTAIYAAAVFGSYILCNRKKWHKTL